MNNSRDKGNTLEERVVEELRPFVERIQKTVGSGAFHDNGDIVTEGPSFLIECKRRDSKSISIPEGVLSKVVRQATRARKDPVVINQLSDGSIWATISIECLKSLLDRE